MIVEFLVVVIDGFYVEVVVFVVVDVVLEIDEFVY